MVKSSVSPNSMILLVAAFLFVTGNATFISNVLKVYPVNGSNALFLLSLIIVFSGTTVPVLATLCFRRLTKPILVSVLLLSSAAAYFMDNYGVIISDDMIRNITHTDSAEALELLSNKLLAYLCLLGVLPSMIVAAIPLEKQDFHREIRVRLKMIGITAILIVCSILAFGKAYASFFREHKELRQHANPAYYLYSIGKYAGRLSENRQNLPMVTVGPDAAIPPSDVDRELIIMVVGEAARADRFSLNGYQRETNPRLNKLSVVNFTNFWACGTSTAVSVPCMFLLDGRASDASSKIAASENLLDVLQRSKITVLWRDNNSDSKGVANRVTFQDYKTSRTNTICDVECRDEGMLAGLQDFIDSHPKGDIFIVLHQMGNHGPAYFRRYPPEFEKFKPACKENDLSRCTREEIGNAYDNATLYTDHFLAKAIGLLKNNDNKFETALFYVSDHGESLGENGLYLHGLPRAIAPDAQLHIPAIMWFGSNFRDANMPALRAKANQRFTHTNVFHTLLGLFEIETTAYRPEMDILDGARPQK